MAENIELIPALEINELFEQTVFIVQIVSAFKVNSELTLIIGSVYVGHVGHAVEVEELVVVDVVVKIEELVVDDVVVVEIEELVVIDVVEVELEELVVVEVVDLEVIPVLDILFCPTLDGMVKFLFKFLISFLCFVPRA